MGCNTSKETIATSEEKEHINGGEENCINEAERTETKGEERTHSAKTITINKSKSRPSSGATSKEEPETNVIAQNGTSDSVEELQEAATKIQAAFRGHKTRKSMKQADKPNTSATTAEEDMAKEFRPDDKELCNAATKIQASFRGHVARKQLVKEEHDAMDDKAGDVPSEELDFDLADPDLNKAAVKIQASFRGHLTRKGNEETK